MNRAGILIIEDNKAIKNLIATTLEMCDYHYMWADKGEQGVLSVASQWSDIILLDLGLPDMDGMDVIKRIRSWSEIPIIVISAGSEDDDEITALDAGTDGYLAKPFSVDELLVRLRTTQRRLSYIRSLKENQPFTFINGGLIIDYAVDYATLGSEEPRLTPYEYKLLCLLAHNVDKVLAHSYITGEIRGVVWEGDVASLWVFAASLKKKVEGTPSQPQYIQTHVGIGYRILRQ